MAVKSLPANIDSEAQIEDMARRLQEILQNSARACGRVSRGRRARSSPWWNQECKDAHDDLPHYTTHLRRGEEVQRSRVKFCRILKRTRQKFWRNTINEVTTAEGVYKLTRWMKPRQRLQPPPLQVGDMTYSTDVEKAMALRKEKLERRDASDDIANGWQPAVSPPKEIPFARIISTKEVEKAVLHTGNTTPGSDGITTRMLQAAWPHIARPVTTLYNACLRLGHHPSVFKTAEVVMIPKLNKRDLTSFLLDRLASVRFQNATTPSARLRCGLPQGSPSSTVIYILITVAIYFLSGAAQRYGYADDTAMLFIGDSLEDTARQANEAIAAMESWGRGEAIHFDPEKTEVMHFSRRKADHDQSPIIHHGDKEIRAAPSMRWLGIWLDK
ncbi:reverse transcriptase [Akanthomyces lecanii RCEF 1005]|uniref:Reverse transcriptase n=1 Tax=Akanthomyces lecanii RCEF 1005 TaxID=1081108 RepID=A0A167VAE2_CORDF|nr:reverse transcriptase [Akanthomyces lecanii RCEF 1005]